MIAKPKGYLKLLKCFQVALFAGIIGIAVNLG